MIIQQQQSELAPLITISSLLARKKIISFAYMKKFITYILKMYIWSVIIITMAVFLEVAIEHHFSPPIEDTPFSSPAFAALMCGVFWPPHNLPVLMFIYRYKFNRLEVAVESLIFLLISVHIDDITNSIARQHGRIWWLDYPFTIIYGLIITVILCMLYERFKAMIVKKNS